MKRPEQPDPTKKTSEPPPSRTEEALRIIQQYADDLRSIIKELRRRLN